MEGHEQAAPGIQAVLDEMRAGFAEMRRGFEQVDQRFEQVDRQFEGMDGRLTRVERFEVMIEDMRAKIDLLVEYSTGAVVSLKQHEELIHPPLEQRVSTLEARVDLLEKRRPN